MRVSLLAVLALAACSAPPAEMQLLEPPAAGEGVQLVMRATIASGQEVTYCQHYVLPEGGSFDVSRLEHRYSKGSHHMILFTTALKPSQAQPVPFDCGTQALPGTGIVYAVQQPQGQVEYPPSVALKLPGSSVVLVQSHYLNVSPQPVDAEVRVNLYTSRVPVTTEVGNLFFYNNEILVPANGEYTARMHCEIPSDVTMMFATSHMHRRGVGYRSSLSGSTLFTTTQWENVEPKVFNPLMTVRGGQAIDFECDFKSDGRAYVDGPSATDNEMCMFLGSYYPKLDAGTEFCGRGDSGPVHSGTKACGASILCARAATDPVAAKACFIDTCGGSSRAMNRLSSCIFANCVQKCPGAEFDACVMGSCGAPFQTCLDATCN